MGRFLLLLIAAAFLSKTSCGDSLKEAKKFLKLFNERAEKAFNKHVTAQWNYNTHINDKNEEALSKAEVEYTAWLDAAHKNASKYDKNKIEDYETKRLLDKLQAKGTGLSSGDTEELTKLKSKMIKKYSTAKICGWKDGKEDCDTKWPLDPDVLHFMATSKEEKGLSHIWNSWREAVKELKPVYKDNVKLKNKGAKKAGFKDQGDWWRSWYQTENWKDELEKLYFELLPLYERLHAYVRHELREQYPKAVDDDYIPAHLTGSMWASGWENIYSLVKPFKDDENTMNVTKAMEEQGWTAAKIFHKADKFFRSLGLKAATPKFWEHTIKTKPEDRDLVCHATAWDFFDKDDFRVTMCTRVTEKDLVTVHHEMGHIQYYMQYAKQHVAFRESANPGFHEGIGDTLALSVGSPNHLMELGLLPDSYESTHKNDVKYLLKKALEKVGFLPWAYLMDLYRWQIFEGSLPYEQWNQGWWKLRNQYQGVKSPVDRPEDAFDPASKSHINDNTPYTRYFVAMIIQFQFYQAMCNAAGHKGKLHECDFYNNKEAGKKLEKMMEMGSSKPWPEAMEMMTGQRNMNTSAILEYFEPLTKFLTKANIANKACHGWGYNWPREILCELPQPRCGLGPLRCPVVPSYKSRRGSKSSFLSKSVARNSGTMLAFLITFSLTITALFETRLD